MDNEILQFPNQLLFAGGSKTGAPSGNYLKIFCIYGGIRKNVLGKNPMTEGIFPQRGGNRGELVIPHREKAIDLETVVPPSIEMQERS